MPRFRTDKLTANAVALLVATVVTGLGVLAFWELVAARTVAARGVGTAYAEVSALTLIAMIAQLNLTNVFIRFVPAAGRFTTRFVFRGYMAVCLVAVLIGLAYVVSGLADQVVPSDFPNRILFVAAVPLFAVFASRKDSVLTALRITHWVPGSRTAPPPSSRSCSCRRWCSCRRTPRSSWPGSPRLCWL